jgi:hypothetical protein
MSTDLDLENRRLCPDGACIGVIGKDGRCKVCGALDTGVSADTPAGAADEETDNDDADDAYDGADDDDEADDGEADEGDGEDEDSDEVAAAADRDEESAAFDADRELCPDGACIGVIGPKGRCKVCATPGTRARA